MNRLSDSITPACLDTVDPTRVLLAEDDPDLRGLMAGTLRAAGYEVIEARDGTHFANLVRSLMFSGECHPPPEVVISDVRMPGSSGLDVVGFLRSLDWQTRVVLVTGFGDSNLRARAARLGVDRVLDKPFDLNELRRVVEELAPIA